MFSKDLLQNCNKAAKDPSIYSTYKYSRNCQVDAPILYARLAEPESTP